MCSIFSSKVQNHSLFRYGSLVQMSDWSWGSFTSYVDQILPNFDHLPPSSGQFTYYLHFVHVTNRGLSADHLPTSSSSCPRSSWMTPCINCASLSAPKATGSSPVAQQTCFAKAYSRKHWCKIVQTLANAKILGLLCACLGDLRNSEFEIGSSDNLIRRVWVWREIRSVRLKSFTTRRMIRLSH